VEICSSEQTHSLNTPALRKGAENKEKKVLKEVTLTHG
jgi:hypothetical protein